MKNVKGFHLCQTSSLPASSLVGNFQPKSASKNFIDFFSFLEIFLKQHGRGFYDIVAQVPVMMKFRFRETVVTLWCWADFKSGC